MLTLLIGFVGLVLVPAVVLAIILNQLLKRSYKTMDNSEELPFTMSSHLE